MDKITFGAITVETTRKCNMSCRHCLRGDSQNKDIDFAYIDALLDQADMIDSLYITGGEPEMALDALEYFADGLKKRGVLLLQLQVLTNGFVYDNRFIKIIKKYRKIIDISCGYGFAPGTYDPAKNVWRIHVGVSLDKYHEAHAVCTANYKRYKKRLEGIADVCKVMQGNAVVKLGRAINLPESVDQTLLRSMNERKRVEVLDREHTPICYQYEKFKLIDPGQKIVCCMLYLTSDGFLKHGSCGDISYDLIDSFPAICKVTEPIWDAIIDYGKGRVNCIQAIQDQGKLVEADEFAMSEMNRLSERHKDPETFNELSPEQERLIKLEAIEAQNAGCITPKQIQNYYMAKTKLKNLQELIIKPEQIYKESFEYHHGSGTLPESRRPKPEPKLDRSVRCWWCGKVIINSDGKKIHMTDDNECQYCHRRQ